MAAGSIGIDVTSIIALLSVAGLAVSLALQNTLSNLAGGIMLLVTKPFQVGDYVEADGVGGTIAAVDLSYTTFVTVDNKEIFVPNSQLSARQDRQLLRPGPAAGRTDRQRLLRRAYTDGQRGYPRGAGRHSPDTA